MYDSWDICKVLVKHDHGFNMKTFAADAFHFFFFYQWYPVFCQVIRSYSLCLILVSFPCTTISTPLLQQPHLCIFCMADVDLFLWFTHICRHTHNRGWQRMIKGESHQLGKQSIRAVLPSSCISTLSIGPTLMLIQHPLVSLTCSFTLPVFFITNHSLCDLYVQFSLFSLYSQWFLSICHHHFESSVKIFYCSMQLFVLPPEIKYKIYK